MKALQDRVKELEDEREQWKQEIESMQLTERSMERKI